MTKLLSRADIAPYLFEKLVTVEPWPPKIVGVPSMVEGTAFFPGGAGLWLEEATTDFPDVMILGQDFSTQEQHMEMLNRKTRDIDSPTWRNFLRVAEQVELDLKRCFFTNAVMGLRDGGSSQGPNPGYKKRNQAFVQRCHDFLHLQIATIRPKLIVVLGMPAARVLSSCSNGLAHWKNCTYSEMDARNGAFVTNVRVGDVCLSCVSLVHPSYRGPNVAKRRYKELSGDLAEIGLLRDAMSASL